MGFAQGVARHLNQSAVGCTDSTPIVRRRDRGRGEEQRGREEAIGEINGASEDMEVDISF